MRYTHMSTGSYDNSHNVVSRDSFIKVRIPTTYDEMGAELTPLQSKFLISTLHRKATESHLTLDFGKMMCYGHGETGESMEDTLRAVIASAKKETYVFIDQHPEARKKQSSNRQYYDLEKQIVNAVPTTNFEKVTINCQELLDWN